MFVLSNKKTFRFRVEVRRANDETGKWDTFHFIGEFKRHTRAELDAMIKAGLPSDNDLIAEEFVGWSGVQDTDGKELDVSESNRAVLLAQSEVRASIVNAWLEVMVRGHVKN